MMAATESSTRHSHRLMAMMSAAGLAIAIAAFLIAMPQGAFEALISALGIPSLFSAATPPLGTHARVVAAGIAALISGGGAIAWLLPETPPAERFRRMINPIHAASELGQPDDAFITLEGEGEDDDEPLAASAAPEHPEASDHVAEEPIFVDFAAIKASADPHIGRALSLDQWRVSDAEVELTDEPLAILPVAEAPRPPRRPVEVDASIPALMRRLEEGLQARVQRGIPAHVPPRAASGEHLRETLDTLRMLASGR